MKPKKLKTNSKLMIAAAALILFCAGVFARAPERGFMGRSQRGAVRGQRGAGVMTLYRVLQANREELKISDAQLEKIKKIAFSFEEKMVDLKNKTSVQQLEMKKLMMAEKKDYQKIKAALSAMSDLRHEILIEGMKTRDVVNDILTPEQQEALKKLRQERSRGDRFMQRGRRAPGRRGVRNMRPFQGRRNIQEKQERDA